MDLTEDKKQGVLLDLLEKLMDEMKTTAGGKLKPKEAVLEVTEPEAVEPDGDEPSPDGEELSDEDIASMLSEDEPEEEAPKSLASMRLAKRLAASKQ